MWTAVASMSISRDAVGVCLLGDKLYAVGGYDGQTYLNTVESYDPQTNEWTQVQFLIRTHYAFISSVALFAKRKLLLFREALLLVQVSCSLPPPPHFKLIYLEQTVVEV